MNTIMVGNKDEAIQLADEMIAKLDKKDIRIRFKTNMNDKHNCILIAGLETNIAIEY